MINTAVQVQGPAPFAGAYYFLDDFDVHVSTSGAGIDEHEFPVFEFSPNPATDLIQLESTHSIDEIYVVISRDDIFFDKLGLRNLPNVKVVYHVLIFPRQHHPGDR